MYHFPSGLISLHSKTLQVTLILMLKYFQVLWLFIVKFVFCTSPTSRLTSKEGRPFLPSLTHLLCCVSYQLPTSYVTNIQYVCLNVNWFEASGISRLFPATCDESLLQYCWGQSSQCHRVQNECFQAQISFRVWVSSSTSVPSAPRWQVSIFKPA